MNTYEALLIFPSQLKEEQVDAAVERIHKEVARAHGEVAGTRFLGRRGFARTMNKREAGVYVRMGLRLDPATVDGLRARLRLVEDLFRTQLTRVPPDRLLTAAAVEAPAAATAPAATTSTPTGV